MHIRLETNVPDKLREQQIHMLSYYLSTFPQWGARVENEGRRSVFTTVRWIQWLVSTESKY